MTIAVLAHPRDAAAARLVTAWRAQGARLIVPRDLSRPGWRQYIGGRGEEWFVAEGERLPVRGLRGVLSRLPVVDPEGLDHLHEGDRSYAATEMTAFLLGWLAGLRCPVLNRPVASSILGPGVSEGHLPFLAARAGLELAPAVGQPGGRPGSGCAVTVVGERCLGTGDADLAQAARRVAQVAGAELLTVHFDATAWPARLVGAELLVDTDDPGVAGAVLDRFDMRSPS
jgi:hypothetical protein